MYATFFLPRRSKEYGNLNLHPFFSYDLNSESLIFHQKYAPVMILFFFSIEIPIECCLCYEYEIIPNTFNTFDIRLLSNNNENVLMLFQSTVTLCIAQLLHPPFFMMKFDVIIAVDSFKLEILALLLFDTGLKFKSDGQPFHCFTDLTDQHGICEFRSCF